MRLIFLSVIARGVDDTHIHAQRPQLDRVAVGEGEVPSWGKPLPVYPCSVRAVLIDEIEAALSRTYESMTSGDTMPHSSIGCKIQIGLECAHRISSSHYRHTPDIQPDRAGLRSGNVEQDAPGRPRSLSGNRRWRRGWLGVLRRGRHNNGLPNFWILLKRLTGLVERFCYQLNALGCSVYRGRLPSTVGLPTSHTENKPCTNRICTPKRSNGQVLAWCTIRRSSRAARVGRGGCCQVWFTCRHSCPIM